MTAPRLTVTVPEAGVLLGIGRRAAYEAARSGALPTLHFGGRVVVPLPRLLELVGGTAGLDPDLLRRIGITAETGQGDEDASDPGTATPAEPGSDRPRQRTGPDHDDSATPPKSNVRAINGL